ncbi:hypothetical protein Tco_0192169, partial [Tanacetum coccineum]
DFLDELAKLQLQEQEARDAGDLFERTFTRSTKELLVEELLVQEAASNTSSTTRVNPVPNTGIFTSASYDDEGAVADFTNLDSTVNIEPKTISQALEKESWVDAMQEELLQFEL